MSLFASFFASFIHLNSFLSFADHSSGSSLIDRLSNERIYTKSNDSAQKWSEVSFLLCYRWFESLGIVRSQVDSMESNEMKTKKCERETKQRGESDWLQPSGIGQTASDRQRR